MHAALAPTAFVARLFGRDARILQPRARVTKLLVVHVPGGATRELPRAAGVVTLHCRSGQAWITHDGDPRDVVLAPNQSHRIDRGQRLTAHAMDGDCALELQVDAAN
ncbi:MAG: DUF2917 domain-containing protein [Variovorax sp.]|nr:MAG: DUF2917 domain-containing protein [Variovorax sp.]